MTAGGVFPKIEAMFAERGATEYHGEAVTQLEHALQTAWEAEKSGAAPELIAAALLHDIGHLLLGQGEHAADRGLDDRHEELGYRFLAKHFRPAVSEPVRLHVPAKQYLCAAETDYLTRLSPASVTSLALQGGPMSTDEANTFETNTHYRDALALRRWDDVAKVPGLVTPSLNHYLNFVEQSLVSVARH